MSIRGILDWILNEDGVSPVIGEILMVAIVVLMAAVVAAFVFGVVTMPTPTPQASLAVDDATWDGENLNVTLLHESGSSLDSEDIEVVVTNLDDKNQVNTSLLSSWNVEEDWSPGERISQNNMTINDGGEFSEPGEIEVRVVHEPSGGTVSVITASVTEI